MRSLDHWKFENYVQRMTRKQWKEILLENNDTIIFHGKLRRLQAKNIGFGLVEVSKK